MHVLFHVLFIVSLLALAALLWTSIAIVRHVRRANRNRQHLPGPEEPGPDAPGIDPSSSTASSSTTRTTNKRSSF